MLLVQNNRLLHVSQSMANGKDLSVFPPDPDLAEVLTITDETKLDIISMQMITQATLSQQWLCM